MLTHFVVDAKVGRFHSCCGVCRSGRDSSRIERLVHQGDEQATHSSVSVRHKEEKCQNPLLGSRVRWIFAALAAVVILAPTAAAAQSRSVKTNSGERSDSYTQIVLPFSGLKNPGGVAVDKHGDVFVSDSENDRVLELPAGSSTPIMLPFTGLAFPDGIAVDKHGDVLVSNDSGGDVLEMPAGSSTQVVLPFTGLVHPTGVAVDKFGDVFVSNTTECQTCTGSGDDDVLELPEGSSTDVVLPFSGLYYPRGIAVEGGNVFLSDGDNDRILELPAGSNTQAVVLTGLDDPSYLALGKKRALYVGEVGAVLKFSLSSSRTQTLPFNGLSNVRGVAVDKHGDVFAADAVNDRVLELQRG